MMCTHTSRHAAGEQGLGGSCFRRALLAACPALAQNHTPSTFAANVRKFGLAWSWHGGAGDTSCDLGRAVCLRVLHSGSYMGAVEMCVQRGLFVGTLL